MDVKEGKREEMKVSERNSRDFNRIKLLELVVEDIWAKARTSIISMNSNFYPQRESTHLENSYRVEISLLYSIK